MLHVPALLVADEHMAAADQHGSDAAKAACQQQSQDTNLLHCIPLTHLGGREKPCWPNGKLAGRQQGQRQAMQRPQDVHDLHTARKPEDHTADSSISNGSAMANVALPISQVLPDTAMELWDFGGDEQPEYDPAAAGLGADSKAAEALHELEEFYRSEHSAGFQTSRFCVPLCNPSIA